MKNMDSSSNNTNDCNKSAPSDNSIARELLNLVSEHGYARKVPLLKLSETVMPYDFELMSMSKSHWVDDTDCYVESHGRNPNCLFKIFGRFSDQEACDVREDVLRSIEQESELFMDIGSNYLDKLGMDLNVWLEDMLSPFSFGDELCLFALARRYNRHVLVHTKNSIWCTIENSDSMSEQEIIKACHLRLIYLGRSLFGIVRKKMSLIDEFLYPDEEPSPPKKPRRGRPRKPKQDLFAYRRFSHTEPVPSGPIVPHPPNVIPSTTSTLAPVNTVDVPAVSVLPIPHDREDLDIIAELQNIPVIRTSYNIGTNIAEHAPQGPSTSTSDNLVSQPGLCSTVNNNSKPCERLVVTPPLIGPVNLQDSAREVVTPLQNSRMDVTDPASNSDNYTDDTEPLESSLDVQENLHKLWIDDAKKRKYTVLVNNLSKGEIYDLQPHSEIDPYSSLEEVSTSDDDEPVIPTRAPAPVKRETPILPSDTDSDEIKHRYPMRERKVRRHHLTDRPQRSSSETVNYYKMDLGLESYSPKRKPKTKPVPSEPSNTRRAAQNSITRRRSGRKFFRKDPSSQPSRGRREAQQDNGGDDVDDNMDSDTVDDIPMNVNNNRASKLAQSTDKAWIKKHHPSRKSRKITKPRPMVKKPREKYFLRNKSNSPKVEPCSSRKPNKGSKHFFKTEKHGVPVRTTNRWFKCTACPVKKGTRREINDHYRSKHPSIRCPVCRELFFTPATLQRHSYYHIHPLQFPCGYVNCDKVFPFTSDRDRHSMVHRTVKTQQCMSKGCGKWFLTKGELVKHAKIHDGIMWKCSKCDYENPDERNLKSHEWKHTEEDEYRYECDKCGKRFVWYMQYKRHSANPKKCEDELKPRTRSGSPDY